MFKACKARFAGPRSHHLSLPRSIGVLFSYTFESFFLRLYLCSYFFDGTFQHFDKNGDTVVASVCNDVGT